jgi:glycosyltransferase involved in cell wall biosynthesis
MIDTPFVSTLHGRLDISGLNSMLCGFPNAHLVSISNHQRIHAPNVKFLRTIYHGINVNDFQYHDNPGSGKYLAFLGRISSEKRPELAIEIAHRSGVPLKIAAKIDGKVGQDYYDRWVKPHVDGKFIEYVGEISESEKSQFLGEALAMVFPIDWPEPFGLVMIESLACGTPVLARPCGSVPELLEDGKTGFLDYDIGVLASKVKDIHQISRKSCREWVEKKFSLQRMTEDYIDVYRHVAAKRARSNRHRWNFVYPLKRVADGNSENQL